MSEVSAEFKSDVATRAAEFTPSQPGVYSAINWSTVKTVLGTLDDLVVKFKPLILSATPEQYDDIINLVAALLHTAATTGVAGSPTL